MYHVQTEDSGPERHTLVTLLYHEGAILRSQKTSYADLLERPDAQEMIKQRMKEQHKVMIKGLIAGQWDDQKTAFEKEAAALSETKTVETQEQPKIDLKKESEKTTREKLPGRSGRSLDDILLEHISRKVKER